MIQLYADHELVYDSRANDMPLLTLSATLALNKGGAATITMPPRHPAYDKFISYKTIVSIYRDNMLLFRGRALYPTDDFLLRRTITCEGERCFLRDAINRPQGYAGSLSSVFKAVISYYNNEVEESKRFAIGNVSVINESGDITLEIEEAETFADTLANLVSTYGGYIVFTNGTDNKRTINWLDSMNYVSSQTVELGKNLVDFSRTTANSDLATVIIPYGKRDESGTRIDIRSVNGALDFIEDEKSVKIRGRITKTVVFDNIDDPTWLLVKAKAYLNKSKNLVSSLSLSAIDLSLVDKTIDSFKCGDNITVKTKAHGIYSESYLLTEQSIDFLNPQNDRITLGRSIDTLSRADAEGDKESTVNAQQLAQELRNNYTTDTAAKIESTKQELMSAIKQTSEEIKTEVSETYATNDELKSAVSTAMTQTADAFEFEFSELEKIVDANNVETRDQFATIEKSIRFEDGNIILGQAGNALSLKIASDRISFLDGGAEVAYMSDNKLHINDSQFINSIKLGQFEAKIRPNGNLSIVKLK